jgi:hypothetical protein
VSDLTPDSTAPRQRNTALMAALALVTLAALVVGAYTFLGGDSNQDGATAAPDSVLAATEAGPELDPAPEAVAASLETLPMVTYDVFLARDPFDPVVPEPVAAASDGGSSEVQVIDDTDPPSDASEDGAGDGSSGDGDAAFDGDSGDHQVDDAAGSEVCRGGPDEVVCDGHVVSLLSLTTGDDPVAVIQVDTETYGAKRGQAFAERFLFLDVVDEGTIRLLYGDEVFRISIGERVMK